MLIIVTAAVIEREGAFLVTRRPEGVHLEGIWEFPGGKVEEDETLEASLRRELREELDVDVNVGMEIFSATHAYGDRTVRLHFFSCWFEGEPRPMIGQEARWVRREDLAALEFPPADEELIRLLTSSSAFPSR